MVVRELVRVVKELVSVARVSAVSWVMYSVNVRPYKDINVSVCV